MTWLCRCDCGVERIVIGESLRSGNTASCGCHSRAHSKPEKELLEFVRTLVPDAEGSVRTVLPLRLELDIYSPSLKRAVEYDGEYWHSTPRAKQRDRLKDKLCRSMGIELLRISDRGYRRNPERIKQLVRAFFRRRALRGQRPTR